MEDRPMSPKREARVMISENLLREAEELGVDLSETLEDQLLAVLREKRNAVLREQVRPDVEEYNARIERQGGPFGAEYRTF